MNIYSKIAEGLAAWLAFEHRCGRANLFSEASLAHPLGDLLQYRFSGRVRAEVEHATLAPLHRGVGRKPRVDFAVDGPDGVYDLVVEAKWASHSPTLLSDILADIVRLDLPSCFSRRISVTYGCAIAPGRKMTGISVFGALPVTERPQIRNV